MPKKRSMMHRRPRGFFLPSYDGAHRFIPHDPPIEALERGPVWIVDAVHGHIADVVAHASLVHAEGDDVLVLYDETPVGTLSACWISQYETATIVDPEFVFGGRRLWRELERGTRLALVHAFTGDFH